MKKLLMLFCLILAPISVLGAGFSGDASVNITSDTASSAKNMALSEARRQIITEVLSNYAAPLRVKNLVATAKDSELQALVTTTGIENEKLSDTAYSADIKISLSEKSAREWLLANGIENTVGTQENVLSGTEYTVDISGGLSDWLGFRERLRASGQEKNTVIKRITGTTVYLTSYR